MIGLWNSVVSWFLRGSARGRERILCTFESPLHGYGLSVPAVKGEIEWVTRFLPATEFHELFGGFITWHPTHEIGETIGVWGKRNVSRFRRVLRERSAEFEVVGNEGPQQRPWVVTTHGYTKKGLRMLLREQDLSQSSEDRQ